MNSVVARTNHLSCHVLIFDERAQFRGVINGKAGKAAALPKFSDMLTLSQPGGADYAHPSDLFA